MSTSVEPADRLPAAAPLRYGLATQLLHWGAAVVLVCAFGIGLTMDEWPRGPERDFVMMLHYSLGSIVLATVLLRLVRRLVVPQPPVRGGRLVAWASGAAHAALYLIMVALPVTGAMDRWARGRPLRLFGDNVIPAPFPISGGKLWEEVHEVLAWTLVALVAAHLLGALWHHLVRRDDTLRRMLPWAAA